MTVYTPYSISSFNNEEVIRICINQLYREDSDEPFTTYEEAHAITRDYLSIVLDSSYYDNIAFRFFIVEGKRKIKLPTTFYGKTIITIRKPKRYELPNYSLVQEVEYSLGIKKRPGWKTYKGNLQNKA